MKISVWDTYVKRDNGKIMHFDIIVKNNEHNEQTILNYGKEFLNDKPFKTERVTSGKCNFCHIEQATDIIMEHIEKKGFYIIEMENCD